jgi:hypothetical protein
MAFRASDYILKSDPGTAWRRISPKADSSQQVSPSKLQALTPESGGVKFNEALIWERK